MLEESGKWIVGVIMGWDSSQLSGVDMESEDIGVLLVFCELNALVFDTISATERMNDLGVAGFRPVGAVVRDRDGFLLCGRAGISERFQKQLLAEAERMLVEAGVTAGTLCLREGDVH